MSAAPLPGLALLTLRRQFSRRLLAVLPLNGDTYITLMFQDPSYTGPIEITVAFVQTFTLQ